MNIDPIVYCLKLDLHNQAGVLVPVAEQVMNRLTELVNNVVLRSYINKPQSF